MKKWIDRKLTTEILNSTSPQQIQMNKIRMKICSKICNKVALMKTKIANFNAKINRNFNHNLLLEKKNNNKLIF